MKNLEIYTKPLQGTKQRPLQLNLVQIENLAKKGINPVEFFTWRQKINKAHAQVLKQELKNI